MHKPALALFALLTALVGPVAAYAATHYDAAKDFRLGSNPNGVWSYMDSGLLPNPHYTYENVPKLYNWARDSPIYLGQATVISNRSVSVVTLDNGTTSIPPGFLILRSHVARPGPNVQFTAPTAGTYVIKCEVIGINTDEAPYTGFYIVHNGNFNDIWFTEVDAHTHKHVTVSVVLAAGDTLDFIDPGNPRSRPNDVGFEARITGP